MGRENVFDDPKILEEHSRDLSFVAARKPIVVVRPKSAEDVQRIVDIANEDKIPLVPCSSGPPRFRGATIPALGGSVTVDLSQMNDILTINRRNKIAVVEAGVTFEQLIPELKKHGLRPYMPLLPRRTKSALMSAIEREPILIPRYHWDMLDPLVSVEVVYGTGDIFRTGEASLIEDLEELEEGAFSGPMGPGQFDPVRIIQGAQGTMGIVTWGILRCELYPELQKLYFIPSSDLKSLIEFVYVILKRRLGEEVFLLNNFSFANIIGENFNEIRELSNNLPHWILVLNLAGYERSPEKRVEYQERDIRDIAKQFGLDLVSSVSGVGDKEFLKILESLPKDYWKLKYKGCFQDLPFLTTLDRVPEFIDVMLKSAEKFNYPSTELGMYIQPVIQGVGCHCEFNLMYDRDNPVESERIKNLYIQASQNLISNGAFFSRPYGGLANMVYNRDAESNFLLKKVKGIFDPNWIMNPGKLCF
ncbi:MAG: FAD-binding oxidoreductase [Candidatus Lokiarchaeia archaeon]